MQSGMDRCEKALLEQVTLFLCPFSSPLNVRYTLRCSWQRLQRSWKLLLQTSEATRSGQQVLQDRVIKYKPVTWVGC
jgi:hypothetical protein